MVFETVVTRRSVGECINSMDRALRNLGSARNSNNDREVFGYYDILSNWGHNLGSALLNEWLSKVEKVRRNFQERAGQIGVERAAREARAVIDFYKRIAESFSNSEKTSKYASLNLQSAGKAIRRRFKKIEREVEHQRARIIRNMQDAQKKAARASKSKQAA